MKNLNIFVLLLILCFIGAKSTQGQTASESLNYSASNVYGTARLMGLSGAMNSIGADVGLITQNPAALGAFWKSEFVLSGGMSTIQADSRFVYGGQERSSISKTTFMLPSIGYVYTNADLDRNLMAFSFGLGYNKISNLNFESSFSGENSGSITEYWMASIQDQIYNSTGISYSIDDLRVADLSPENLDAFQNGLGFDAYALDTLNGFYFSDYLNNETSPLSKNGYETIRGKTDEIYMAFGGNIKNKILFGATIGVPLFNYKRTLQYNEFNGGSEIPNFGSLNYSETLTQRGAGVNLKVGVIAKFNKILRLSGAIHTPSFFVIQEEYYTNLVYSNQRNTSSASSPILDNEYVVVTPWKFMGGVGVLLGKSGFIDAEINYIDYSSSKFDLTYVDFNDFDVENEQRVNNEIQRDFRSAINFKLGGEYAINNFRVRAGLKFEGAPQIDSDAFSKAYSLGIGYRGNNFYIDAALVRRTLTKEKRLYPFIPTDLPQNEPLINQQLKALDFALTVGFKL